MGRLSFSKGQGSMEYVLLIGGAILVVTVVLFLLIEFTIPSVNQIVQNNLSNYPAGVPAGYSGVGSFGTVIIDWKTMSSVANFSPNDYNGSNPPALANFTITNTSPTNSIDVDSIIIFFDMVDLPAVTNEDFEIIQIDLSTSPVSTSWSGTKTSGQNIPLSFTLNSGQSVQGTIVFDTAVNLITGGTDTFSLYSYVGMSGFNRLPVHAHQTLYLEFLDSGMPTPQIISRSSTLHQQLAVETISGNDASSACDGEGIAKGAVSTFSTATDALDSLTSSVHGRDLGYSASFGFDGVPLSSSLIDTSLFIEQSGVVEDASGLGHFDDSDPIFFIVDDVSQKCSSIDNANEVSFENGNGVFSPNGSTVFSQAPISSNSEKELKGFDLSGMVKPGDNRVFFTMAGDDYSGADSGTGNRAWYSSTLDPNQPPVLVIRYSTP